MTWTRKDLRIPVIDWDTVSVEGNRTLILPKEWANIVAFLRYQNFHRQRAQCQMGQRT